MKRSVVVVLFLVLSTWFPRNGFSQSITELEKLYLGKWVLVTDQKTTLTIEKLKVGYLFKIIKGNDYDLSLDNGDYIAYFSEGIMFINTGSGLVKEPLVVDNLGRLLYSPSAGKIKVFVKHK